MSDAPQVKPGHWIRVGTVDCVVIEVPSIDPAADHIDVICNPDRPAVYGVNWGGGHWSFAHPMRGDHAEHHPSAAPYVATLAAGRGL
jgi:hypothetical protein